MATLCVVRLLNVICVMRASSYLASSTLSLGSGHLHQFTASSSKAHLPSRLQRTSARHPNWRFATASFTSALRSAGQPKKLTTVRKRERNVAIWQVPDEF
jgi:hypothetical protein